MIIKTQAEADKYNNDPEYGPYLAANGHLMRAHVRLPRVRVEDKYDGDDNVYSHYEPRDLKVGDQLEVEQWSAWCDENCGACAEGDPLPDW